MSNLSATAVACANIAFIKYWGNRDQDLRLPTNASLSMNLDGLYARTQVTFNPGLTCDQISECDQLMLNDQPEEGPALARVSRFLDHVRAMAGIDLSAQVVSENNFPTGAGIASSAAAFAALALAASHAAGLGLSEHELSRLARLGSGSACRSIPTGFVEWHVGTGDHDSYAVSIARPNDWDLTDCVAVITSTHKEVGSTEGHRMADASPLQAARIADTPRRMDTCRRAILTRDFTALAEIIEQDSTLMHAVMMTSQPPLFYWQPASLRIMNEVRAWRKAGLPAAYTLDAGPNVHVICETSAADQVQRRLLDLPDVQRVFRATPGGPAHLLDETARPD